MTHDTLIASRTTLDLKSAEYRFRVALPMICSGLHEQFELKTMSDFFGTTLNPYPRRSLRRN
jgi:hypothetical protein